MFWGFNYSHQTFFMYVGVDISHIRTVKDFRSKNWQNNVEFIVSALCRNMYMSLKISL